MRGRWQVLMGAAAARPLAISALAKLLKGLAAGGAAGGPVVAGVLHHVGAEVLAAMLAADANGSEVRESAAVMLLSVKLLAAAEFAAQRSAMVQLLVLALIELLGPARPVDVGQLAAKLCLNLARDSALAGDFKVAFGETGTLLNPLSL